MGLKCFAHCRSTGCSLCGVVCDIAWCSEGSVGVGVLRSRMRAQECCGVSMHGWMRCDIVVAPKLCTATCRVWCGGGWVGSTVLLVVGCWRGDGSSARRAQMYVCVFCFYVAPTLYFEGEGGGNDRFWRAWMLAAV